jgi:hypothetical protein
MHTDNTIILRDENFENLKENELKKEKFLAKSKEKLTLEQSLIFHDCILTIDEKVTFSMRQKDQTKKIHLVNLDTEDFAQRYVKQRARDVYIASICQLKVSFNLSAIA